MDFLPNENDADVVRNVLNDDEEVKSATLSLSSENFGFPFIVKLSIEKGMLKSWNSEIPLVPIKRYQNKDDRFLYLKIITRLLQKSQPMNFWISGPM